MRAAKLGVPKSEAFKQLLSELLSGENNPFYGRKHSAASKLAISTTKSEKLYLYDAINLELLVSFNRKTDAQVAFKANLARYIDKEKLFRGKYLLKTSLINLNDTVSEENLLNRDVIINLVHSLKYGVSPLYVYDASSLTLLHLFNGATAAKHFLHISLDTIRKYQQSGLPYKGMLFRDQPLAKK